MTTNQAAQIISSLPGVAGASAWNDRVYVNLDAPRGEKAPKIWIKGDKLQIENVKGYMGSTAGAAFAAFRAALEDVATCTKSYSDTIESTWQIKG